MKKFWIYAAFILIGGVVMLEFIQSDTRNDSELSHSNAEKYITGKTTKRQQGYAKAEMPEQIAIIEKARRTPSDQTAPGYKSNYRFDEFNKMKKSNRIYKNNDAVFKERGPANVAGRTRGILVSQSDINKNTWLAGSASGGIWKTADSGQSWTNKTQYLPNLGTSTLAGSKSNPLVVYAGTGEHFTRDIDGSGMFKSIDFGETWVQVVNPDDYRDFRNIAKIIVDPQNENIVIATTRNSVWADSLEAAIYKSMDGGLTWDKKLSSTTDRFDDINYNPLNFNTQYVSIDEKGILKSTDGGDTWFDSSNGLQKGGRIELDVSPVDTSVIWACIEGSPSNIYYSQDGGALWTLILGDEPVDFDILGGQGWYDNIITAHPFDEDVAYVGGVNLWKVKIVSGIIDRTIIEPVHDGSDQFLSFINFGGTIGNGGIDKGEQYGENDLISIELRFGGNGQKAHRFTVGGRGPGVPAEGYEYLDYIDIPFQAWDVDSNRQLMVSFRDQQEDGEWNLISTNTNGATEAHSREYIYIHNVDYSDVALPEIAVDGGQEYNNMYFMWPVLSAGSRYSDNIFPVTKFSIDKLNIKALNRTLQSVSDAYSQFDRINTFSGSDFENNKGVHPDQHNIVPIIQKRETQFRLLVANDGGLYVSNKSFDPGTIDDDFNYAGFGYNTTQFYSADKAPGKDRYIGGMQDNGTWLTASSFNVTNEESKYDFALGGDGFEAIWHNLDDQLLLGTIQFNSIQKSTNGGRSWSRSSSGLTDVGEGSGPFISRLANSKSFPDRVFAIGASGVWISNDFGDNWELSPLGSLWSFNNFADVEVSLSDINTVWAGGVLDQYERLFVSTDGGNSFIPSNYYTENEMGRVSGLATDPKDKNTAYALFSFASRPKILKTSDLGETWVDITGFDDSKDGVSTRGFPDVAVNALYVFPNNTNRIWAGTEIGIVESQDNGLTWNLLEAAIGAANIYDFVLQDDQIVIATYGRGIWTAEIEGLSLSNVIPPLVAEANIAPSGNLVSSLIYYQVFDSSYIYLNDQLVDIVLENSVGNLNQAITGNVIEGDNLIQIISYKDGVEFSSNTYVFEGFKPNAPIIEYFNDLSDIALQNDFFGTEFSVAELNSFDNEAIHSLHPYEDNIDVNYILKKPVKINGNQILSYRDIAIIETGEDNSTFGSDDFYDYVVVEATLDGINWSPLADGYDARFNPVWEEAFNNSSSGRPEMFTHHEIDLSTQYALGDTILIRFRLSADPILSGWGWAIDDIIIQPENTTTPTVEVDNTEIKVYPNPAKDIINISGDTNFDFARVNVRSIDGRNLQSRMLDNKSIITMDISAYPSGVYLVEFVGETDRTIQKIIKE